MSTAPNISTFLEDQKHARSKEADLRKRLQDVEDAAKSILQEIEEETRKMQRDMEDQRKSLQEELDKLTFDVDAKQKELADLQNKLALSQQETQDAKNDALINKSTITKVGAYINPMKLFGKSSSEENEIEKKQ